MIKDTNEDQSNEETYRVRSERVSNTELLCPLPVESGHVILGTCVFTHEEAHWSLVS